MDGKSIPKHAQWFLEEASLEIMGLKHEYMKAGPALADGDPTVWEQLSPLQPLKEKHTLALVPTQNRLFCLQLTFDSGRIDMACHLASFKALYFGLPPHYVDLQ